MRNEIFPKISIPPLPGYLFLLFIAWVGMKAMQYHGDYERMIRDAQRFLRENDVVGFVRDKAVPAIQDAINTVKGWFK